MKILYIEQNTKINRLYGNHIVGELKGYGAELEILLLPSLDEVVQRLEQTEEGEIGAIICGTFGGRLAEDGSGKILGPWRELRELATEKGIGNFALITALPLSTLEKNVLTQEGVGLIDKGELLEGCKKFCESFVHQGQEIK
jgi:hypothetical protein